MVSSSHTRASVAAVSIASQSHPIENPFAATYFYAYQGVIFEVCKNHHLASVTLFREE
jgi:hypothetical protein